MSAKSNSPRADHLRRFAHKGAWATLQAGIEQFSTARTRPYMAHWAANGTDDDLGKLHIQRGDPAGQARLEPFSLLSSVVLWQHICEKRKAPSQ